MADGPSYRVGHRRRREQKTDYDTRLELLKSGRPRAVVRRSNKHCRVQLVGYQPDGDEVMTQASSEDLEEFGWEHHTGNLPAAYLTGYLAGTRALDAGIEEAVVDTGMQNLQEGNRIFAAIKGIRDAGVQVQADESVLPSDERAHGQHIEDHRDNSITANVDDVKAAIEG